MRIEIDTNPEEIEALQHLFYYANKPDHDDLPAAATNFHARSLLKKLRSALFRNPGGCTVECMIAGPCDYCKADRAAPALQNVLGHSLPTGHMEIT